MTLNPLKRHLTFGEEYNYPTKKQKIVLYLDDCTPIRTVQVTNLEDNVCAGYLRAYFECKIGPVFNVTVDKLKLEGSDNETRIGYVTFVVPEDAARSIYDLNLQSNCKFTIEQADDDHQPKIDPKAVKFEELNDECLMHITSFLNLINTINLCKTSRRLSSFAEKEIYPKRTRITLGVTNATDLSINKKNVPTILKTLGKYFKTVQWIELKDRQMDQLTKYCKNVIALELVAPNLHLNSIERNQIWFRSIESLKIENADFYDTHVGAVTTASTHLKSLQLINCSNVRGNFLSEWKDSPLKNLRMVCCQGLSSSNITDFLRKNNLVKFSSDTFDSFITCLTLPAPILYNFTELELAANSSTDMKLGLLKLDELKQLEKIRLKCTFFNYRVDRDVTVAMNFNNVFVAMSPIHTLTSITVELIIVDVDTFTALQSIPNLRELNLKNIYYVVEQEMYSSLHVHLPKLTKLSMSVSGADDRIDYKAICDMVSGLVDLKYFSHSPMTWRLLKMIRNVWLERKRQPIEIGIPPILFNKVKKAFSEMSRDAITLSLVN